MICSQCGGASPDHARFCQACGESLLDQPRVCSACGSANDKTSNFCTECGVRLAAPVLSPPIIAVSAPEPPPPSPAPMTAVPISTPPFLNPQAKWTVAAPPVTPFVRAPPPVAAKAFPESLGPFRAAPARRGKGLSFGLWFAALFLGLVGLDYVSTAGGRIALLLAFGSGAIGYSVWPRPKK